MIIATKELLSNKVASHLTVPVLKQKHTVYWLVCWHPLNWPARRKSRIKFSLNWKWKRRQPRDGSLTDNVVVLLVPVISRYGHRMVGRPHPQQRGQRQKHWQYRCYVHFYGFLWLLVSVCEPTGWLGILLISLAHGLAEYKSYAWRLIDYSQLTTKVDLE